MRTKALTVAAGVVVATAAIGGVAYAEGGTAAPSAPAASAAAGAPAKAKHPARARLHRLAEHALHGQFTVERKGSPVVVDAQRGTVTAASPTSITVRSKDGFTTSYALTAQTKVRTGGKPATVTALASGKHVAVVGTDDGGHPSASIVRVLAE